MASKRLSYGDAAMELGQFTEASAHYSMAIKEDANLAVAFVKRAEARIKLQQFDKAIDDINVFLSSYPLNLKARLLHGMALFGLEDYRKAITVLADIKKELDAGASDPDKIGAQLQEWLVKCESKLGLIEVPDDLPAEAPAAVKDSIVLGPGSATAPVVASEPSSLSSSATSVPAPAVASASSAVGVKKPRYEWYQTAQAVTVTLMVKDVDQSRSSITVDEKQLSVTLGLPSNSDFVLDLDLYDSVVPGAVNASYRPTKVEIKLQKGPTSQYTWPALEASAATLAPAVVKAKLIGGAGAAPAPAGAAASVANPTAASAPTSASSASSSSSSSASAASVPAAAGTASHRAGAGAASAAGGPALPAPYAGKKSVKDWSALEKEIEAEEEAEKPEGEEALQKLFRQIYKNGDEDTRKAMVKSFQTSGGTVLSTNWKDVAKRDYEKEGIQAPAGMEVKKWGKD